MSDRWVGFRVSENEQRALRIVAASQNKGISVFAKQIVFENLEMENQLEQLETFDNIDAQQVDFNPPKETSDS